MWAWPDPAAGVVALLMLGVGLIFWWYDRDNPATRALSLCVLAIGLRLLAGGPEMQPGGGGRWFETLYVLLDGTAIIAGIEWGRRIAQTGTHAAPRWILVLFRVAQGLALLFLLMRGVYELAWPEVSAQDVQSDLSRVSGLEWAVFAPILGSAILCVGIALIALRVVRIDAAEQVRLQSLGLAGPFLLSALFLADHLVPPVLALGLLVFLWGSVRYLLLLGRRGDFMRQFLSPEVAQMVQAEGMERALQQQRRVLSVVSADLRGFTSYARTSPPEEVTALLEAYYELVGDVAAEHGGTVKDHAGDGVLILVGAPYHFADHAERAVCLALALREQGAALLAERAPDLGLGVGVATGHVTVGAIRGAGRLEYVAVGNPVNLAARLCDRADEGEVLSDGRTVESLGDLDQLGLGVIERKAEPLKGFPEPIPVCALLPSAEAGGTGLLKRRRRGRRKRRLSLG